MKKIQRKAGVLAVMLAAALLAGGCAGTKGDTIRVGSKDFTEGLIVGEIYALALEDAGFQVERSMNIAGSLIHTALTDNEIDLYPEYTGTALLSVLKLDMNSDPQVVYDTVKKAYEEQFSLTWLDSTQVNDTNGLAIRTEAAEEYGIRTISDLQAKADQIRLCSQGEFEYREDGIPGLAKLYGDFDFASVKVYDSGLKYQILENGEADVCPAYSTDAALADTEKFLFLEDDLHFWPPYYLAPVVRSEVLEKNPRLAEVLNAVSARLDTETMIGLNAQVDLEKREYEEVAAEFYESIREGN